MDMAKTATVAARAMATKIAMANPAATVMRKTTMMTIMTPITDMVMAERAMVDQHMVITTATANPAAMESTKTTMMITTTTMDMATEERAMA